MGLADIYSEKHEKPKLICVGLLYLFDKLIIGCVVALAVFAIQHQVEMQDVEWQMQQAKDEKIAQVINDYSSEIMTMSTSLDEVDRPLSDETLWSDYKKAESAIESLLIQESLNKNAFAAYSSEIKECKDAVGSYCGFIKEVLDPNKQPIDSLSEYSNELKKHHNAIQSSCINLSNHCSDVLYGYE